MKTVAIDFETANGDPASVCSVGVSTMEDGAIEESYYSLIKPEANVRDFNYFNIKIHGIHPEDVDDSPEFYEVYRELMNCFDDAIICAHNAKFDMTCLKAACINTGRRIPVIRYFDTVELSRRVFPSMKHHRLDDMCDYLNISLDHHNALSDSYGCLMIVAEIMNLTGIYDIEELLESCNVRIYEL